MTGFDAFRNALPDLVVRWADPRAGVSEEAVRLALTWTIMGFIVAVLARVGLQATSALIAWLEGHRAQVPLAHGMGRLRWWLGFATMALPWCGLAWLHWQGDLEFLWYRAAVFAGTLWLLVCAADHGAAYLDKRAQCLVIRRGFGLGPMQILYLPLADVFTTVLPGDAVAQGALANPTPVTVHPKNIEQFGAALGSTEAARHWLQGVAAACQVRIM